MVRFQFQSVLVLVLVITISIGFTNKFNLVLAQPTLTKDTNLKVQLVAQGLRMPTSMAFLGPNDILVMEKESGTVQRVVNGKMLPQPVLQVPVSTTDERGMLGIAIAKHSNGPTYVFLYYTKDGGAGSRSLANVLYRYELSNDQLVNPKLLLNLPALRGPAHNGGKVLVGPDSNVYTVIGDLRTHRTQAQNVVNGPPADSTGGILRVTQNGQPVTSAPLGQGSTPLDLYYAYGVRNSFGIDFDPVSGKLWDTENGPTFGDEINLVEPGFNSGWAQVMGIWTPEGAIGKETPGPVNSNPSDLVNFDGKGKYRTPEFIWFKTVAPTALKFLSSDKLGKQYENDMFVGDIKKGNLYHFDLNEARTGLVLNGTLANKIANTASDSQPLIFATGFDGGITDLQVGPDGYLYVLTLAGSIYKITPS
ncbi:MAG TPA: PQQ-dependent sugar dehydrogenase [Nitrososphaeraceae archaeon]|jgi:glucose/arabinose dehydrogenase|nr:PQQ-dependent sugar dehydrogenase [Nitrososphaeraceae archaeon]